ncbi:integral membrane sensor signal transduction histidine kinase [Nostoc sp. NIES-2111]|nr:integral membrane sensor signal transduction histidine kinase [Nostoc sp. NIES-2111]
MRKFLSKKLKLGASQVVALTVVLTILLFVPQIWLNWQAYRYFNNINKNEFQLQTLSNKIIYFDEVLTMSARMNAATGNPVWEQRYRQFEPQLDIAIQQSIKLAPTTYQDQEAARVNVANQKLVSMEYQSFELVKNNQKQAAQILLSSQEYETQKRIYADGVAKRNNSITLNLQQKVNKYKQRMFWSFLASITSLFILIPAWLIVLLLLQKYLYAKKLAQVALEEANSTLEIQVEARTEKLHQKNLQLQQTLQELQNTQVQLVQSEKMSSLGKLVAGIAHEINNPVNFIYGNLRHCKEYIYHLINLINLYQQEGFYHPKIEHFIDEIELDFIREDLQKILASMEVGSERIREIVLTLRNFSRLDEAEMKPVDIHDGINSTLLILQHNLKSNNHQKEIILFKDYGNLPLVECHAGKLNQVFMNIFSNAVDALRQQEIKYIQSGNKNYINSITIHTEVQNETHIIISIKDTGFGMSEEIIDKIFDPFFTTKPVGQGTGLGLSISYKIIVDKHKGKIECLSSPGKGTEFLIQIPIKQNLYLE